MPQPGWAPAEQGWLSAGFLRAALCLNVGAGLGRAALPARRAGLCSLPRACRDRGKPEMDGEGNVENSPNLRFFLIFDFNCVSRIFRFLWIIRGHGPATEVITLSGNCFVLDFLP